MEQSPILKSKTTDEVWRNAQKWEEAHWVNAQRERAKFGKNWIWRILSLCKLVPKHRGDDWNTWWMNQFNNYSFLPPEMGDVIEVGCGPYTNVRLMRDRCRMKHLVLSDPLIRTYVKFKLTFVREMYDKAACSLDDHPLEELPFKDAHFDMAVMINVLDHVRDANACMENFYRVVKPGGIVIFGQDLSREEDAEALLKDPGLAGHPIKLHEDWFGPWIEQCEPIIHRILKREEGRNDEKHYSTLIFAGRIKPRS
jgi:ubiquinone/menaquinone biosynthesis C-methylase UbiE